MVMEFSKIIENILLTLGSGADGEYALSKRHSEKISPGEQAGEYFRRVMSICPEYSTLIIENRYLIVGTVSVENGEAKFCNLEVFSSKGELLKPNQNVSYSRLDTHFQDNGIPLSHHQPHIHQVDGEIFRPGLQYPNENLIPYFICETLRSTFDEQWYEWVWNSLWKDSRYSKKDRKLWAYKFYELMAESGDQFFDFCRDYIDTAIAYESMKKAVRDYVVGLTFPSIDKKKMSLNSVF